MRHWYIVPVVFLVLLSGTAHAQMTPAVSRRDGFLMIWRSISRPAETTKEKPFPDVRQGSSGFQEITYAKARGILDDDESFHPDDPLTGPDALLWLLRTRGIERIDENGKTVFMELAKSEDVLSLAGRYLLQQWFAQTRFSADELTELMRSLDATLASQEHEVSLYAEKFHGDGTAFGETFDMYALTAAHRTFPYNTLVLVTNLDNGKSVTVRINDRGPFVQGRDMDLSLQSFTTIADRAKGKIRASFERLGDVNLVRRCRDDRSQRRVTKDVILSPGVPHSFALGKTLRLLSSSSFVVRDVIYPDGTATGMQTWVTPGERFEITPSVTGTYSFVVGTVQGRQRTMEMEVVDCGGQ